MTIENHLKNLLNIVLTKGDGRYTGNLFYEDLQQAKQITPLDSLKWKRENLSELSKNSKNALEIGFAAGHSALLMLLSNSELILTVVDPCEFKHTMPCYEYLNEQFPGRINFIRGFSPFALSILPQNSYDLVHLDGGKHFTIKEDLDFIQKLVTDTHVLCIDDTQNIGIEFEVNRRLFENNLSDQKYIEMNTKSKQSKWTHCICEYVL